MNGDLVFPLETGPHFTEFLEKSQTLNFLMIFYLVSAHGGLDVVHDVDFDVVEDDTAAVSVGVARHVVHNVAKDDSVFS